MGGMTWYMNADDISLSFKETVIYVSIMIKFPSNLSVALIYQTRLASFYQRNKLKPNISSPVPLPLTLLTGEICSDRFCHQIFWLQVYDYSNFFTGVSFDSEPSEHLHGFWKLGVIGRDSYVESAFHGLNLESVFPCGLGACQTPKHSSGLRTSSTLTLLEMYIEVASPEFLRICMSFPGTSSRPLKGGSLSSLMMSSLQKQMCWWIDTHILCN